MPQHFLPWGEKSMWRLFKTDHYSILEDDVYVIPIINCGTDQVWLLIRVWHLTVFNNNGPKL